MVDMNERLRALGEMVREQTEQGPETEQTLRFVKNRLRLTAYAERKRRVPVAVYLAFATSAVAAAIALVIITHALPIEPLSVTLESQDAHLVGHWVESQNETKQLRFSDGTSVALGPETAINVQETTQFGGTVIVGQGRARAQIVHVANARWTFVAGPFHVRVTGTEFDLAWDPGTETLELALHQGSVELSGPTLEKPRQVRKGEFVRLQLAPEQRSDTTTATDPAAGDGASTSTPNDKTDSSAAATNSQPSKFRPRDLSQSSTQELWDLGQNARLSGNPTLARDALLALRTHHGTRGPTAFLLGKINADQLQNSSEAIRWFQTYLKEVPGGSLSEQTWGRLIELQAGTSAGRQSARTYLERYPGGSYKTLAQRSLQ